MLKGLKKEEERNQYANPWCKIMVAIAHNANPSTELGLV
jgi:hypothetical protein